MFTHILNLFKIRRLKKGDRVRLSGGYEIPPGWLCGKDAYYGEIVSFMKGPLKGLDAVVKLDETLIFMGLTGDILIMSLRYSDAVWGKKEIVHIHLFSSIPDEKRWANIDRDEWRNSHIESHASYRIVK